MNSQHPPATSAWARLAAAARRPRLEDTPDIPAPYGFATRVAARAMGMPPTAASPFFVAKLTLRVLCVACLLAIVSVGINLGSILRDIDEEAAYLGETPIVTAAEPDSAAPDAPAS